MFEEWPWILEEGKKNGIMSGHGLKHLRNFCLVLLMHIVFQKFLKANAYSVGGRIASTEGEERWLLSASVSWGSVETLLSSKAGCRGIKYDPVLLHAWIHKKHPTFLMNFNRLLWHIINSEAAIHVLLICHGICNWIWPPVTLKIWLSVPKDIHMFYEGRVCFNKPFNQEHMLNKQKAFIDFINSKTMSTLSQANYCRAC